MALYVVVRENDYFPLQTYVEDLIDPTEYDPDFEVDVPEQMVQPVRMVMEGGRYIPMRNYGLAIPLSKVRPFLLRIQKRGIDKRW